MKKERATVRLASPPAKTQNTQHIHTSFLAIFQLMCLRHHLFHCVVVDVDEHTTIPTITTTTTHVHDEVVVETSLIDGPEPSAPVHEMRHPLPVGLPPFRKGGHGQARERDLLEAPLDVLLCLPRDHRHADGDELVVPIQPVG